VDGAAPRERHSFLPIRFLDAFLDFPSKNFFSFVSLSFPFFSFAKTSPLRVLAPFRTLSKWAGGILSQ
jgi:hypothetical protein